MLIQKLEQYITNLPDSIKPNADLRVSNAGECPRKLDYMLVNGRKSLTMTDYLRMASGTALHTMLQDLIKGALGDAFTGMEEEVELCTRHGFRLPGHPDGIIQFLEKLVLEIKTVSANSYEKIKNTGPFQQHKIQAGLYAEALEIDKVLILYYCKDNSEFLEFELEVDRLGVQNALDSIDERRSNYNIKRIADRPYIDKTASPCFYCDFKEECYKGFASEVKSLSEAELKDEKMWAECMNALKHRQTRLISAQLEDSLKERVGKEIYLNKMLNSATVSSEFENKKYLVKLKVGKNDNLLTEIKEV